MNDAKLARAIDELGALRAAIENLSAKEKALTRDVRKALAGRKDATADGEDYRAELVPVEGVRIADLAALRRVAGSDFLDCVRANMTAVRKVLTDEAIAEIGVPTTRRRLDVRRLREPATMP